MRFSRLASLLYLPILLAGNAVGFSCSPAIITCYRNRNGDIAVRRRKPTTHASSEDDNNINNNRSNNQDPMSLDMNILQQRMNRQQNQYAKLIMEQSRYMEQETNLPESVHIILFNPDTPNQNIHTLEIPKGSGNNMILAFEDGADCGLFAQNLRELEFKDPSVSVRMYVALDIESIVLIIHVMCSIFINMCNVADLLFKSNDHCPCTK